MLQKIRNWLRPGYRSYIYATRFSLWYGKHLQKVTKGKWYQIQYRFWLKYGLHL